MWQMSHSLSTPVKILYVVEWEVLQYLNHYFPKSQTLGPLLTLTGSAIDSQATACEDYLKETWPAVGLTLVFALEEYLRLREIGSS
jgi:hypothetical protein